MDISNVDVTCFQAIVRASDVNGCKLKILKNLKTVIENIFLYNLIVKHGVICHENPELHAYAWKLAPMLIIIISTERLKWRSFQAFCRYVNCSSLNPCLFTHMWLLTHICGKTSLFSPVLTFTGKVSPWQLVARPQLSRGVACWRREFTCRRGNTSSTLSTLPTWWKDWFDNLYNYINIQ